MSERKLGVSNIAWDSSLDALALDLLADCGADGVEVAPTKLAPWDELTPQRLAAFRDACVRRSLTIPSLQAIFFGVPEAALLADSTRFSVMAEQVRRIGGIACALGATIAVFGAPKNRLRGELSLANAMDCAVERLSKLGDIAAAHDLILAVEAVPASYGCDFLNTTAEVATIVDRCHHPNIRAHVDIACASLAGCDPAAALRSSNPVHYHIAEPDLRPLRMPICDHAGAAAALAETGYNGWMVIEMREDPNDDLAAIRDSIAFAKQIYLHY